MCNHGGWEKYRSRINTYHEVAYRTNTLAAFPMAVLASLEMLTFSGSCNQREAFSSKLRNFAISNNLCNDIQESEALEPKIPWTGC